MPRLRYVTSCDGATAADLESFKKRFGAPLPDVLARQLLIENGGVLDLSAGTGQADPKWQVHDILSVGAGEPPTIVEMTAAIDSALRREGLGGLGSHVPFASNGFGGTYFFNLEDGVDSCVYVLRHDFDEGVVEFVDLQVSLDQFLADISAPSPL